ncbi:Scaffold-type E3 ligase [Steccherinum ochraceum]|uniref:Defective in cullin neddylation protein n=1 Tax=Steccherinum ochraceum TaxID=92696 RepID=A0A4R0R7J1_9APHY|nr:Scaffold-type E3 ligase [Steccherinum ochraceum]
MSKSSGKKMDKAALDAQIQQFCTITSASVRDAKRFLEKYKRVEIAVDAYYNEPAQAQQASIPQPSTSKLNALFDKYKDPDSDEIAIDGTIKLCEDLKVDPEDVVLLSVAYQLKSPKMGEWSRKGWVDGWKELSCDTITAMSSTLVRLRDKLGSDSEYFAQVYNYTFDFSRPPGQRSLALDMAQGFWGLLIPHGLQGGALSHLARGAGSDDEDEEDDAMMGVDEEGWKEEYTQWWFEYLTEKGGKGVSKDTWQMFLEFVRTIDAKFEKFDEEGAWPSTIDDFVAYARERLASGR